MANDFEKRAAWIAKAAGGTFRLEQDDAGLIWEATFPQHPGLKWATRVPFPLGSTTMPKNTRVHLALAAYETLRRIVIAWPADRGAPKPQAKHGGNRELVEYLTKEETPGSRVRPIDVLMAEWLATRVKGTFQASKTEDGGWVLTFDAPGFKWHQAIYGEFAKATPTSVYVFLMELETEFFKNQPDESR